MESEKGLSQVVSKLLLFHGEEFRRVFYEKADDGGFINQKIYKALIDEIGYLLPAYHKEVKTTFWKQNKKAFEKYNLKYIVNNFLPHLISAISYIDFLEILSLLLKSPNQGMREIRLLIAKLNKLLRSCKDELESRLIENTLDGLYQRLYELKLAREGLTPEEKEDFEECNNRDMQRRQSRLRALKELFGNYCKKAISLVKRHGSFDAINLQTQGMSLENFCCLLKDLRVRIDAQKVTSLFNKTKRNGPFLNFEEFCILIEKAGSYSEIIQDPDHSKATPSIKAYKPDSYKNIASPVVILGNKSKAENVEDWKGTDDPTVRSELFWIHTGIENGTYKKIFRDRSINRYGGSYTDRDLTDNSTFDIYGAGAGSGYIFKTRPMVGRTAEEVRLELERRKEEKQRSATTLRGRGKVSLESLLDHSSSSLKRLPDQVTSKVQAAIYQKSRQPINGLTLKKLQNWDPKYNKLLDRNFNPSKLFGENDSEDDHYLAEYQLPPQPQNEMKKPPLPASAIAALIEKTEKIPQNTQMKKILNAVKVPTYLRKYSDIHEQKAKERNSVPLFSHHSQRDLGPSGNKYFHEEYAKETSRSNYIEYKSYRKCILNNFRPAIPDYVAHHVQQAIYSDSRRSRGDIMYSKEDQPNNIIREREVEETITTPDPLRGGYEGDGDMIDEMKPQRNARRREPTPPNVGVAKKTNEGNVIRFSDFMKQRGMSVN